MSQEPDLEELIEQNNSAEQANLSFKEKAVRELKYFVVDGTSSALFYAPIMAATERLSGMDWEEVGRSRSIGAVAGLLTGYGYSLFRKWSAQKVGVNTESSPSRKRVVDTAVGMMTTLPVYAPMLYFAGASSKEMAIALVTGSALGAAAGGMYGYVADRWRTLWGLEPVLNK
ncbi:MAG TPA: L-alanine exporter AlaE [Candidatus Nanoarchaeia archaeon]|nr:L-alanine exporter AlaE [Candidatus Nanoarchaeia archaeon]